MTAPANVVDSTRDSSMAAPDQRPGPGSYTKNNSETFKLKMELLVAERRYSDLLLKNSHLESDNKHLESKNQHLERDNKVLARKLELESATKASVIQHAEESITDLLDQLSRIHTDFEAARQEAGQIREQNQILHAEKSQLSNDLSLLRTTNIELDERNQQLSAMHTTSQEDKVNLARLTDDRRSLRARNESNEKEMEVLRDRIAAVETDLDWHRSEHVKMLEIRNSLNADRGHESPQVVRLRADVTRLKAESKEQKDSIAALKRDVALYFANLDLAAANVRVYTCKHRDLRNIRHDQNETKQKKVCLVSDEFVGLWKTDMEFLEQYNSIRQGILGHHRAHECMHIGRGNSSQHVKNVFVKVDQRRGVFITYD